MITFDRIAKQPKSLKPYITLEMFCDPVKFGFTLTPLIRNVIDLRLSKQNNNVSELNVN